MHEKGNTTSDVSNTGRELRATIQYSRLQIEAVKLWMKGYSENRMADILGVTYQSIHRALKAFEKAAPVIRKDFIELSKMRYFEKKRLSRMKTDNEALDRMKKARMRQEELINEGYWPHQPPMGYKRKGKLELILDPKKDKIIAEIYRGWRDGEGSTELTKKAGVKRKTILHILSNPFYCGEIKWKGKTIQGKHPPIISKQDWELAQKPKDYPVRRRGYAPYGYRSIAGQLKKDPEKALQVQSIFELRAKHKRFREISKTFGLKDIVVRYIIKNPIYRGVTHDGRPMPGSFEPLVDASLWWNANSIHTPTRKEWIEAHRGRIKLDEALVLGCLHYSTLSTKEIVEKTKLSESRVVYLTQNLKHRGVIEKRGGKFGKWHTQVKSGD